MRQNTIFGKSEKFSRFLPHICRILTILASHLPKSHFFCLTRLPMLTILPSHVCRSPRYVNYRIIPIPDTNNPMQRICEEKARRILHWALMKDCQCEWGKYVNGGQVAAESRRGPKCDEKFTICGQSSKFSRFIVTLAANSHASSSHLPQNSHDSSSH